MGKLFVQMLVCIALVVWIFSTPLGDKVNGMFYDFQHRNDPAWASNPPTDGFMGDQVNASCTPVNGYMSCFTLEFVNVMISFNEGQRPESHVKVGWNSTDNSYGAISATYASTQGDKVFSLTANADNNLGFDTGYSLKSATVVGKQCDQRLGQQIWDCR